MSETMVNGGEATSGGYRPLSLTLRGFKGIRSGLGRDAITLDLEALVGDAQLVAIAGSNGRGKTTVMDNLHPFLVMPSRAGADGLGAFSFYDHVFLPESSKELVWRHGGRRYKSQIVFRVNGKKKTEAFLFEEHPGGWTPVVLLDGTVSDGKVDTYERAVADILCAPDTFFTSVFSAQGKRPLSAFKNAEIKTLLADLLGLDQVRQQGALASDVVRQLKAGLGVLRQGALRAQEDAETLKRNLADLDGSAQRVQAAVGQRSEAVARHEAARQRLAQVTAEHAGAAEVEARRRALAEDAKRVGDEHAAGSRRIAEELPRLHQRHAALQQRMRTRQQAHGERRAQLQRDIVGLAAIAELRGDVERALARREFGQRVVARCQAYAAKKQGQVDVLEQVKATLVGQRRELEAIDREAGQIALRQADLQRRFGLTNSVPCTGMDIQGQCQLLGDAREARALLPSTDAALCGLVERKRAVSAAIARDDLAVKGLPATAEARNQAEQLLDAAEERLRRIELLCARGDEVARAAQALAALTEEVAKTPETTEAETDEERCELAEITAARQRLDDELSRMARVRDEALARIEDQRRLLPPPLDVVTLVAARQEVDAASQAVATAERAELDARERDERAKAVGQELTATLAKAASAASSVGLVEQELATWTLLAKCLSNDGVIALDIDDAGPTFSALANDLLLACYGPRFTLQVITQSTTGKGELREDFDIIVHDGWRDEAKSLKLVSGGERVWINECLTRAIALYLSGNTGRQIGTLFSDEADGPLDPEHKRMFMAMKREVLRLGGYECEYFVSQTPELTRMADCIIDLESMANEAAVEGL
jgi:DNA repair protein SbcC/Rad50